MKKIIMVVLALLFCSSLAYAEPSFDQIQTLIKTQNYAAAVQGLTLIIQNHPRSAKAYYAMAQAQAGIGNQAKAKEALDMAMGIDPSLKFASSGNVEKLKDAIQPQTNKIEAVESHAVRNTLLFLFFVGGAACYFIYRRKKQEVEVEKSTYKCEPPSTKAPSVFNKPYTKQDQPVTRATPSYPSAPSAPFLVPNHTTTVVNNTGGGDLMAGMLLGQMIGSHNHETVIEREYIHETPVVRDEPKPSVSSSWDNEEKSSTSSSWDGDKSSSSSSSWDSSSSSSSSWDSGSSSSDSSW